MTIYRTRNSAGPIEMLLAGEDPPFTKENYYLVLAGYFFDDHPLSAPHVRDQAMAWLDKCKDLGVVE
jgi:hypothetical protein